MTPLTATPPAFAALRPDARRLAGPEGSGMTRDGFRDLAAPAGGHLGKGPAMRRLLPLLLAVLLLLGGCKAELHHGLSEAEANEIVAVLLRAGIPASRAPEKAGTLAVSVEESRFADAVDLLRDHGLPKRQHATVTDIFKGDSLVASPIEERARYVYAISEGLAGTIAQIDGVLSARVHIVLPDNDALRRDPAPASAAVFIRHAPAAAVGDVVPQIKMLVANAVSGLTYDKVSVIVVPAAAIAGAAQTEAGAIVPVLGLWVHRDSAGALELALACGGALLLALTGFGAWFAWGGRLSWRRSAATSIALR